MAEKRRDRSAVGFVAVGVAAVLLAAAAVVLLSRDDADDEADSVAQVDPLVVAVVDAMHERSGGTITDAEALCMADGVIGSAGADRLTDLGVLDGADPVLALATEEKEAAIPEAFACLDDAGLVEFMSAVWTPEQFAGLTPAVAPCVFQSWLVGLGRERMAYLYSTFLRPEPPPIPDVLNKDEADLVTVTAALCVNTYVDRQHRDDP